MCAAVAAASLLLPSTPTYDPWLWLSWGREVVALDLDTRAFGSFKPLPVLFTAPLSLLGGAAPALWLVVTRTAGLLAMVLAYRLASRLAGQAAGALAVAVMVLSPDPAAGWVYYLAHGTSETLVTAAVLLAVLRGLDGRHGQALALGALAGLGRPEAWLLLALYGVWLWRAAPRRRPLVAGLAALLAVLWLGGDLWGAGSALRGAEAARGGGGISLSARHLAAAVLTASRLLVAPAWAAAAYGAWRPAGARRLEALLAAGALAWIATVIALGGLHFSAQPRFLTPAGAILAALAGAGAVRAAGALRAVRPAAARRAAAAALLLVVTTAGAPRVVAAGRQLPAAAGRAAIQRDLATALRRAGGAAAILRCPPLTVQNVAGSYTAAAWRLGVRPGAVRWLEAGERPAAGVVVVYGRPRRPAPYGGRVLAGAGRWLVVAVAPASGPTRTVPNPCA